MLSLLLLTTNTTTTCYSLISLLRQLLAWSTSILALDCMYSLVSTRRSLIDRHHPINLLLFILKVKVNNKSWSWQAAAILVVNLYYFIVFELLPLVVVGSSRTHNSAPGHPFKLRSLSTIISPLLAKQSKRWHKFVWGALILKSMLSYCWKSG